MTNEDSDNYDEVLCAIRLRRTNLENDVETKRAALEEAETKLEAFKANALAALGAASGSKSAQKQRAERQTTVEQLLKEGLSRAEIVRRTGLVDHLVGYDIDCLRRRRHKQGTKKVFANPPQASEPSEPGEDTEPSSEEDDELEADREGDVVEAEKKDPPPSPTPFVPKASGKSGVVPAGCSASRDQLKALAKKIQREGGKSVRLRTTQDNDHAHVIVLDLMGDGETVRDDTGHKHRACRFEMLESDHLHGISDTVA